MDQTGESLGDIRSLRTISLSEKIAESRVGGDEVSGRAVTSSRSSAFLCLLGKIYLRDQS